jgi:hypothetical protein
MNIYLASVYANGYRKGQARYGKLLPEECAVLDSLPNILESYHYVSQQKIVDEMRADGAKVFLDSGAFSAFSLGAKINLSEYCSYILRNKDILRTEDGVVMASVLDGIGNPLLTWQNQAAMEKLGVTPLPCFHYGEDERYLEWYIARYPYITLGGMVGVSKDALIKWLDRIWQAHLLDGSGRPKLRVHAFGVTTVAIITRYPWFSVDSSSWIQGAAFGSVYTHRFGPISVSEHSPARHDKGRHLSTFTQVERDIIETLIKEKNFDAKRLTEVYESRAVFSCIGYRDLEQYMQDNPFNFNSLRNQQYLF